jgi:hypothetical protein
MRIKLLKRIAKSAAQRGLFAAAIGLLLASWSGVAQAFTPDTSPEISVGALGGAMTLLSGGLLLLRESIRSRISDQ